MRRGTTPTISVFTDNLNFKDFSEIILSFEQLGMRVDKTGEDLEVSSDGKTIKTTLTQQETLAFVADMPLSVQFRAKNDDGVAVASSIGKITVCDVLKGGVI